MAPLACDPVSESPTLSLMSFALALMGLEDVYLRFPLRADLAPVVVGALESSLGSSANLIVFERGSTLSGSEWILNEAAEVVAASLLRDEAREEAQVVVVFWRLLASEEDEVLEGPPVTRAAPPSAEIPLPRFEARREEPPSPKLPFSAPSLAFFCFHAERRALRSLPLFVRSPRAVREDIVLFLMQRLLSFRVVKVTTSVYYRHKRIGGAMGEKDWILEQKCDKGSEQEGERGPGTGTNKRGY